MRNRKQFRKLWIMVKAVKTFANLSPIYKERVQYTSQLLSKQYSAIRLDVDPAVVEDRRQRLAANKDLSDIFDMFWVTLHPYCTDGILSKEGYIKCNKQLQLALTGFADAEELNSAAETDWAHDTEAFGEMNKTAFFDALHELVETWVEMISDRYEAPFAWGLLDATVDFTALPPRFRPPRDVRPFVSLQNEANIMTKFSKDKAIRANFQIHLKNDRPMSKETQSRMVSRKYATSPTGNEVTEMAQLLSRGVMRAEYSFESSRDEGEESPSRPRSRQERVDYGALNKGYATHSTDSAALMDSQAALRRHAFTTAGVPTEQTQTQKQNQSRRKNDRIVLPVAVANVPEYSVAAVQQEQLNAYFREINNLEKTAVLGAVAGEPADHNDVEEPVESFIEVFYRDGFVMPAPAFLRMTQNSATGFTELFHPGHPDSQSVPSGAGDGVQGSWSATGGTVRCSPSVGAAPTSASELAELSAVEDSQAEIRKDQNPFIGDSNRSAAGDRSQPIDLSDQSAIDSTTGVPSTIGVSLPIIDCDDVNNKAKANFDIEEKPMGGNLKTAADEEQDDIEPFKLTGDKKAAMSENIPYHGGSGDAFLNSPQISFENVDMDAWIASVTAIAESCLVKDIASSDSISLASLPPTVIGKEGDRYENWTFKEGCWVVADSDANTPHSKGPGGVPECADINVHLSKSMLNTEAWGCTPLAPGGTQNVRGLNAYWLGPVTDDPRIQIGWKFSRAIKQLNSLKKILGSTNGAIIRSHERPGATPKRGKVPGSFAKSRSSLVNSIRSVTSRSSRGISPTRTTSPATFDIFGPSSAGSHGLNSRSPENVHVHAGSNDEFASPVIIAESSAAFLTESRPCDGPKAGRNGTAVTVMTDDVDEDSSKREVYSCPPMTDDSGFLKGPDSIMSMDSSSKSKISQPVSAGNIFCTSPVHQYPSSTKNSKNSQDLTARVVNNGMLEITRKRGVAPAAMGRTEPWDDQRQLLTDYELALKDSCILSVQGPPKNIPRNNKGPTRKPGSFSPPNSRRNPTDMVSPPVVRPLVPEQTGGGGEVLTRRPKAQQALVKNLTKKMTLREKSLNAFVQEQSRLKLTKKITTLKNVVPSSDTVTRTYNSIAVNNATCAPIPLMPWVPPGGIELMQSDKGDKYFNWEECRDFKMRNPIDTTKHRGVVLRQGLVRQSFERFVTGPAIVSPFAKQNMNKSHLEFMSTLGKVAPTVPPAPGSLALGSVFQHKSSLDMGSRVTK